MVALLLATPAVASQPLPAGTLCIDGAPCVATTGSHAHVAAAPAARRFVWTSRDRGIVSLGSIAAGGGEVALDGGTSRSLRVQIREQTTVDFEIASKSVTWQWSLTNPPPSIRLIHPSCEGCVLAAEARGFRRFEKPLRAVTSVVLQPWPHVRGRVVDRLTGAPLAGATISIAGVLAAKADADGAFDAAVEGDWPRQGIDVAWPGRAPRRLALSPIPGDTDLGPIALSTGGALRVTIDPPLPQKLKWELRDAKSRDLLRQGEIPPAAAEVSVDGIGEGDVELVLRGERPLQQLGIPAQISSDATIERSVAIEPSTLTLEVTRGSAPYTAGKVTVGPFGATWRGDVLLDADGRATEEVWQRANMLAQVFSGDNGIYIDDERIESGEATWRIEVPDNRVTGRVFDGATGEPIADAVVGLEYRLSRERAGARSVRTGADGRYVFEAVDPGTHKLGVRHPLFPMVDDIPIAVEATGIFERDIRIGSRENETRTLILTDERGLPVPDALVILGDQKGIREVASTALDGTCTIPLAAGERGVIFVIPRSGSFAFLRVPPQRGDDATVPMRVRRGSATIEVETRDAGGKPVPQVFLVVRFNGLLFPAEVTDWLRQMQGISFFTDEQGRARLTGFPPGVYELWAVTGRDQMSAIRSGAPPPPAASLEVVAGQYGVDIGLASK